ncbi:hypothetical protein Hanom_Chr09g00798721 [Helianthus anomalus]
MKIHCKTVTTDINRCFILQRAFKYKQFSSVNHISLKAYHISWLSFFLLIWFGVP